MKTTIDIPDEIFRRVKARAALRGESLQEFVVAAVEAQLRAPGRTQPDRSGWRAVFGLARPTEVKDVEKAVAYVERIELRDWE